MTFNIAVLEVLELKVLIKVEFSCCSLPIKNNLPALWLRYHLHSQSPFSAAEQEPGLCQYMCALSGG